MKNETKKTMTKLRNKLNSFLGANKISNTMLLDKRFPIEFEFPVSGRTIYRIIAHKHTPSRPTRLKLIKRLGLQHREHLTHIEILEDE